MYKRFWPWFGIVAIVVVCIVVYSQQSESEGFADLQLISAQRQQLKYEGQRRYNDFSRMQSTNTSLPADAVDDALRQVIPASSAYSPSILTTLSSNMFSAADNGANKRGDGVEKTGFLAQKIAFCESVKSTTDCGILSDPRYSECGICHTEGVSSKGKHHKGGMYISADDQIRANEVAKANGTRATYVPTVGTCDPANFTMMTQSCQAKVQQMECAGAGAPASSNECGQCFGGGDTLLYVGPKSTYTAVLHVSHPGLHRMNGAGMRIFFPNGKSQTIKASASSAILDPKEIYLEVKEGENLRIVIYGVPMYWCAWLSSPDGTRTVSLDIGVQAINPTNGIVVAGDKRSKALNKAMSKEAGWDKFKGKVPNTVMWFSRPNARIPPAIVKAVYGSDSPRSITATIQESAGAGRDILVKNMLKGPATGDYSANTLTLTQDTGGVITAQEGETIKSSLINNSATISFTVPASLVGPYYDVDQDQCAAGPMVFTEVGAGLMGAHSCYDAKGKFNPSVYCLTKLFIAAGGTEAGTLYPDTAEKAAALVMKDADGKPSLDATVESLNNMGNIAIYGTDTEGAPVGFEAQKQMALALLGLTMTNPCDGPQSATGPHSNECLDYLWRTSGDSGPLPSNLDPASLPYGYCSADGAAAPLKSAANAQAANALGNVTKVRNYFNGLFARSQDSSDFDAQAVAMKACYGVKISSPVGATSCPATKPCDWITAANKAPWTGMDGGLVQATIDEGDNVIGVNYKMEIYRRPVKGSWVRLSGGLTQIDSKGGIVVGIRGDIGGVIYRNKSADVNHSSWEQLPGAASWVSVGGDGELWCVNSAGSIYRWNGAPNWVLIPGGASNVAVGDANNVYVVGYSDGGKLWKYEKSGFKNIPTPVAVKQVSVTAGGSKMLIFGQDGNIYGSANSGVSWTQIGGNFNGSVSISDNYIVAVNSSNWSIYTRAISC